MRPGDVVLDVGAGSGILSMFAARAGAARVYAVEQTSIAVLAQELVAANRLSDVIEVIQGDVMDIEPPGRVDVIVSEWLGGFGIDEGMLVPVIAARDRWLKPGGIMIPGSVTAWTALVHDRYLEETVEFLRTNPYGLDLEDLIEKTVNEISYSGTFRHLAADDRSLGAGSAVDDRRGLGPVRRGPGHHSKPRSSCPSGTTERPTRSRCGSAPSSRPASRYPIGPGDPATHWGMTTAPLRSPVELAPGMVVRARVRTALGPPGRDMDALGHRDAGCGLGRARRAGDLGGDRRLRAGPLDDPSMPRGPRSWFLVLAHRATPSKSSESGDAHRDRRGDDHRADSRSVTEPRGQPFPAVGLEHVVVALRSAGSHGGGHG